MIRAALLAAMALAPFTVLAQPAPSDGLPRLDPKAGYAETRAALIGQGYTPVPQAGAPGERCFGRDKLCSKFPEMENCSDTGYAPCNAVWRDKAGQPFRIITAGEGDDDVGVNKVIRP